jgi:quercetin dioxygenase-like cupin family protein
MFVARGNSVPTAMTGADEFVEKGPNFRKSLIDSKDTGGFGVLLVTFGPGARLKFHTHPDEQILYVIDGKGIVATHSEEVTVTAGDCVVIPPGESHWHGAAEDSLFTHLAIQKPGIKLAD